MRPWLLILWLLLPWPAQAQTDPGGEKGTRHALSLSEEAAAELSAELWSRQAIRVKPERGPQSRGQVLLTGFESIDSDTERPVRDSQPIYQEVLPSDPDTGHTELERWLRRDLHWFVLVSETIPPGSDTWMSDRLDLSESVQVIEVGSEPKGELEGSSNSDVPEMASGLPKMSWLGPGRP